MVPASTVLRDYTPDGAAFGEFLRQARERRGLTLQQISHETKIPWRHLDALEHGQLNAVPGGTYRRGEIRAYAEVVGLDKTVALERLDRALQSSVAPVPAPSRSSFLWWNGHRVQALLTLVVFGAAGVVAMRALSSPASDPAAAPRFAPLESQPVVLPSAQPSPFPVAVPSPAVVESAATAQSDASLAAPFEVPTQRAGLAAGLTITSDPPGARVTVDGIAWGTTPVTIAHLTPGDRRVRLTLPAFSAAERVVRVSSDQSAAALHIVLSPAQPE
jgi:hypothetical protein